ncbi:MAG: hypothetical protein M3285_07015 [Actinomycetota bacterium]|nr:hypothetical protein [Actinomycetota bacterium]
MKKIFAVVLAGAVVAGFVGASPAISKKKKKLVPVEQKYFLRDSDGCDTAANQLSVEDGEDTGCWYLDSGAINDAYVASTFLTREDLEQTFTAVDGVPFKLDATKALTGEIYTSGGNCLLGTIAVPGAPPVTPPCSPAQLKGGEVELEVEVRGATAGADVVLGSFAETFTVLPGDPTHKTDLNVPLDAALNKKDFTSLVVAIYVHGNGFLNGIIELNDPVSFVNVPTLKKKK